MRNYPYLAQHVRVFAHHMLYWDDFGLGGSMDKLDFAYLKKIAGELDLSVPNNPNNNLLFEYLANYPPMEIMPVKYRFVWKALDELLTTIYFAILPNLQLAAIDLYDPRNFRRYLDTQIRFQEASIPYFYLPRFLSKNPSAIHSLRAIVFRYPAHWETNNLGLDQAHFLFPHIPNVRKIIFDHLL